MFKKLIYLLISSVYLSFSFGQNETSQWYAGDCRLNFLTNPPTTYTDNTAPADNNTSISDGAGNILFYYGGTLRNPSGTLANAGLIYPTSVYASNLIVKQPGNNSNYYYFYISGGHT